MHTKTSLVVLLALVVASLLAPASSAQSSGTLNGQESEFGTINSAYSADMNGQRVPVEAHIVIRNEYADKDAAFFQFTWSVLQTPMDVTFDHLIRLDTGKEIPCYQTEGTGRDQLKCTVDVKNLPPAGTEIVMKGTVGSSRTGQYAVGAGVYPFTYRWTQIQMSNGLPAQLYTSTLINVNQATGGSGRLGGALGNAVPGVGVIGAVGAFALAAAVVGIKRRK